MPSTEAPLGRSGAPGAGAGARAGSEAGRLRAARWGPRGPEAPEVEAGGPRDRDRGGAQRERNGAGAGEKRVETA